MPSHKGKKKSHDDHDRNKVLEDTIRPQLQKRKNDRDRIKKIMDHISILKTQWKTKITRLAGCSPEKMKRSSLGLILTTGSSSGLVLYVFAK